MRSYIIITYTHKSIYKVYVIIYKCVSTKLKQKNSHKSHPKVYDTYKGTLQAKIDTKETTLHAKNKKNRKCEDGLVNIKHTEVTLPIPWRREIRGERSQETSRVEEGHVSWGSDSVDLAIIGDVDETFPLVSMAVTAGSPSWRPSRR